MDKRTLLLLSTISFAAAIIAYILYFMSKEPVFIGTAIVTIIIGCIFSLAIETVNRLEMAEITAIG